MKNCGEVLHHQFRAPDSECTDLRLSLYSLACVLHARAQARIYATRARAHAHVYMTACLHIFKSAPVIRAHAHGRGIVGWPWYNIMWRAGGGKQYLV